MNRFYVYALIDPRIHKPFYIGKGSRNRPMSHLTEAKKSVEEWTNPLKCRRINVIWEAGEKVIIKKLQERLTEEESYSIESHYIAKYGRLVNKSGTLTNIMSEDRVHPRRYKKVDQYSLSGVFIRTYDSVQEAAHSASVTENTLSGVINSRCHKNKTLRTAGGYRWTHHQQSLPHYDRYEAIYEPKKKGVCQYSLSGGYIKTYDSAKQAEKETGTNAGRISGCCHKRRFKSANGFCWAFEGDVPRLPNIRNKRYLHQSCVLAPPA